MRRVRFYHGVCQGASASLGVDAFGIRPSPPPLRLHHQLHRHSPSSLLIRLLLELYTLICILLRQASPLPREALVPRVPFSLSAPFSPPSLRISQGSARRGCGVTLLHRRYAELLRCGGWFFEQPRGGRLRRDRLFRGGWVLFDQSQGCSSRTSRPKPGWAGFSACFAEGFVREFVG